MPTLATRRGLGREEASMQGKAPCFNYLLDGPILGNKGNLWYPTETG